MEKKPEARTAADLPSRIIDNRCGNTLAAYLNQHLPESEMLRLVSAYFSVYGYEQIADALDKVKEVKFLFGEPTSAATTTSGEKEHIVFTLEEEGLIPSITDVIEQRRTAQRCKEWAEQESVQVRTISKKNFLHGKMYHMQNPAHGDAAAVGSSNLTKRGLGATESANIELNISTDAATHADLQKWFDAIWEDDELTHDAKQDLLDALARWHEEYAPEFLYYKTLYELFKDELEARRAAEANLESSHLYESQVWKALYSFQKDGAKSVIARLLRHNGCILADSVGLGKTYTALAVIKYFQSRNDNILVLCPKKLEQNWSVYRASANEVGNPFPDDRFSYVQMAHTDLSYDTGVNGAGINRANFNWSNFDLIVIDESHNFRNQSGSSKTGRLGRYAKLMEEAIKKGSKTKVLLLSATPVNTSLIDLRNQVYLMTAKEDEAFADTLQISDLRLMFNEAQKQFKKWEDSTDKDKSKSQLLRDLGGDFLRLLSALTVARSRKQIEKFYTEHIAQHGKFPEKDKPENEYPHTDTQKSFSYEKVDGLIKEVKFHIYQPSSYVEEENALPQLIEQEDTPSLSQRAREYVLASMMRINLLKRFESSAEALRLTLERTIDKIDAQIAQIDEFMSTADKTLTLHEHKENEDGEDDPLEEFLVNSKGKNPYRLRQLDVKRWKKDMQEDLKALQKVLKVIAPVNADEKRDGKLQALKERIRAKGAAGDSKKKLLVFTTFKDTADYLYAQVVPLCAELNLNAAMVAGDATHRQGGGENTFTAILDDFSPIARKRKDTPAKDAAGNKRIDILIATDCISEGQNLHDCDTVLNYDIHWNPVRIIQRFGRIDRIGSQHKRIKMVNFWPHPDHEKYLKLRSRVVSRMMLLDTTTTGDNDELLEAQREIERADMEEQLKAAQTPHDELARRIRDEVVDIDDLPNTVSMGEFTFDYFLAQLDRYLKDRGAELENAPAGIYAVTDANTGKPPAGEGDGVIFFFRQYTDIEQTKDNPIHPFYLVHVLKDGGVRRYHTQPGDILRVFEKLALPHNEPLLKLCSTFVGEIKTEDGKAAYQAMADAAVRSISAEANEAALDSLTQKGATLPKKQQRPSVGNLQLITWLITRET